MYKKESQAAIEVYYFWENGSKCKLTTFQPYMLYKCKHCEYVHKIVKPFPSHYKLYHQLTNEEKEYIGAHV